MALPHYSALLHDTNGIFKNASPLLREIIGDVKNMEPILFLSVHSCLNGGHDVVDMYEGERKVEDVGEFAGSVGMGEEGAEGIALEAVDTGQT